MTSIQLNDREKIIFWRWIIRREKVLSDELEITRNLLAKLASAEEVKSAINDEADVKVVGKSVTNQKKDNHLSWVDTIKTELKHFSHPVASGEIVKRLLGKPVFSEKGKRFITKAVTSKLSLLQERGEVVKTRENGKFVYGLTHK